MGAVAFVMAGFTGHVHSTLGMARDLLKAGHRVVYWGDAAAAAKATAQGIEAEEVPFLRPLQPPAPARGTRGLHRLCAMRSATEQRMSQVAAIPGEVERLLARQSPDLLVFDPFYLCYYPAFHGKGIPAVALSTKPLLDFDPWVPYYVSGVVPGASVWRRGLVRASQALCWAQYGASRAQALWRRASTGYSSRRVIRRLSADSGFPLASRWVRRPVSFDFCLRGVPELVVSAREFDFPRKRPVRPEVHYVGPCLDLGRAEEPWTLDGAARRERLLLCSLGTVEQGRDRVAKRFLRRLVDEFAEDPRFTVILAAGDARMADAVGPPPSNVHVFLSVPQMRVLREADVMITHGGSSSVKECIAMGVPLLVFPRRADQPGNAARVEYHGLGLKGSMRFDRGPAIRRKVERLLTEPHFQRNLSAMRDRFDRYRGVGVAILEYYLGKPASDVASPPMHSSTFGEGGASSR